MSGMNSWLAEIYGTDGGDELEKTAQAHLLNKLAQDNNLDLSQFSEEELQQLLQEAMADQAVNQAGPQVNQQSPQSQGFAPGTDMNPTQMGGQMQQRPQHPAMAQAFAPAAQPQAPQGMPQQAMQSQQGGGDMASLQKEAQAKFEEADLLGRVMAHAYTQELEKIAGARTDAAKGAIKGVVNSAKNRASNFGESAGRKARSYGTAAGMKGRDAASRAGEHVKRNKGIYGGAAAGAAAGAATGRMSKEASAFEKLAEMQAAEILGASGFDPSTGIDTFAQQDQGQQGQADQYGQQGQVAQYGQQQGQQVEQQGQEQGQEFQEALDNRALEMLEQAGYDVNEILARLNNSQGQA